MVGTHAQMHAKSVCDAHPEMGKLSRKQGRCINYRQPTPSQTKEEELDSYSTVRELGEVLGSDEAGEEGDGGGLELHSGGFGRARGIDVDIDDWAVTRCDVVQ